MDKPELKIGDIIEVTFVQSQRMVVGKFYDENNIHCTSWTDDTSFAPSRIYINLNSLNDKEKFSNVKIIKQ